MLFSIKKWPVFALVGLAFLGLEPDAAPAQNFRVMPDQAAAYNTGARRGYNTGAGRGYEAGFHNGALNTAAYGTGLYGNQGSAYGGFLSGAADLVSSQGQFLNQEQDARLKGEQVKQSKVDTHRKKFDEWLYERATRPSVEDDRERLRLLDVRRARNNPPDTEIWSGKALNDLLVAIQKMHIQQRQGPSTPIDPDVLQKINLTSMATQGSLGVLRNDGQLRWPLTLRTSAFKKERSTMDDLAKKAFAQASAGQVDADTLVAMNETVDSLYKQLKKNISKISANEYIKSKRYLNEMEDSIKVLDDPNVSKLATRKWSARGATVGALVMEMTKQGLKFATAVQGDEAAYTALHSAMVSYYTLPDPGRPWDPMAK